MTALTQRTTAGYFGPEPLRLRPIPLHQLLELLHPWTHIQDAIFLFLIGSPCDRRILSILAQTGSLIGFHALSPLVAPVSRGLCLCDIGYGHDHHWLYDPQHLEMGTRT